MAQALFEALAAGVGTMDSQTALAVQSLLETQQPVAETSQDDDDMFQCGKCKKQFNSLSTFVNHKQSRCATGNRNQTTTTDVNPSNGFTSSVAQLPTYTSVPSSPLTQIGQGMVLTDELMTFSIDQTALQSSNLQMATATQGNPFLSQVAPLTPRSTNCTSNFSTISTQAFSANPNVFPATIATNQINLQQISPNQQMSSASIADTTSTLTISKPSPNKAGKKAFNNANSLIAVVTSDLQSEAVKRPNKGNSLGLGLEEPSVKKKLKCQYCDKLFCKNFDLQQHIRSHTGEKPFQCIVCGRAFAQKSNVKKHMQTHKVWPAGGKSTLPVQPDPQILSEDSYVMAVVEQTLETEKSNDSNNSETGSENRKVNIIIDNSYVCQYCNMKFKTYFELKSHMTFHKNEQVYKCILKTCGESFVELDAFLEHTKTHEEKMSYRCHLCNKHFTSLYDLGVHQYTHSLYPNQGPKPGPRYFRCTKCMNKYATPEALEHHMQTTSHKYPCPHCQKTFACERYLRRHLPTHGTIGEHVCEICQKRFKTEHYLKMHALIHSGEKPFRCEQCEAAFNRKDKLKRHMLIHEPIKKYKCPFRSHTGCTKEFNRPDKLKAHIISHSGIKPYKCKECGKAFSRRPHMLEHEKTHRNEYRYPMLCELCGKGFYRAKVLEEHSLVCAGVREVNKANDRPSTYKSRTNKRKVGRPRKKIITVTEETIRENAEKKVPGKRGRPRKVPLPPPEPEIINISKDDNGVDILVSEEIVMIDGSDQVGNEGDMVEKSANHVVNFNLVSGQLQGAGDANMVVTSEQQDLVHSSVATPIENHDSIASTVQAVFTAPGTACTMVDGGLISGHATTCMVMTADSSGNLVATQQTAQLVTTDGAAHLLTTGPDGNSQTYVTTDHIHMGYTTAEQDGVLHGTDGLLATSEDILH